MELELKIVDYETAKRLNALGFPASYDNPVYYKCDCELESGDYWDKHKEGELDCYIEGFYDKYMITAPTLELVKKWLMDTKNLYIDIAPIYELTSDKTVFRVKNFKAIIRELNDIPIEDYVNKLTNKGTKGKDFENYDDALEWGVKECLNKLEKERAENLN